MHDAPSEASILRSMYEKEVRDHEATKLELEKLRDLAKLFFEEEEDYNSLRYPDKLARRDVERARAAVRDLLHRGANKHE